MISEYQHIIRKQFQDIESASLKNHHNLPENLRKQLFTTALCPCTIHKNRYPDILPFERTRVRLQNPSSQHGNLHHHSEGSDYINANYLLDRQYISCQAPIFSTFSDFWRMIWEQKCSVIVMLTRLLEGGRTKANIYWPLHVGVPTQFGDVQVSMLEEEDHVGFKHRSFLLTRGPHEARYVHQIHYTEWPDFGIPSSTSGIRDLVCLSNQLQQESVYPRAPIVVHCSAGVGRSGTFIAIHNALQQIDQSTCPTDVDVEGIVRRMRQDRWGMVHTEKQYEFIYQAIRDHNAERNMLMMELQNEDVVEMDAVEEDDDTLEYHSSSSSCSPVSSCSSTPEASSPSSPVAPKRTGGWRLNSAERVNTLRASSAALSFA